MPVSTFSAAVHITPVVVKTFARHGKRLAKKRNEEHAEEAQDDILFDEQVSWLVGNRCLICSQSISYRESIHRAGHAKQGRVSSKIVRQPEYLVYLLTRRSCNTHVVAPYWAAVAPVCIPLRSCNEAADVLIEWFGPDELKAVVGGERWWQVRGLDGIDGEWITQKDFLSDEKVHPPSGRKLSDDDETVLRMEKLDRVMVHLFALLVIFVLTIPLALCSRG
jgi:hypothetical protein